LGEKQDEGLEAGVFESRAAAERIVETLITSYADHEELEEKRCKCSFCQIASSTSPSACAPGAASSRVAAFAPRYASPDGV
jgi:hypothetical protein